MIGVVITDTVSLAAMAAYQLSKNDEVGRSFKQLCTEQISLQSSRRVCLRCRHSTQRHSLSVLPIVESVWRSEGIHKDPLQRYCTFPLLIGMQQSKSNPSNTTSFLTFGGIRVHDLPPKENLPVAEPLESNPNDRCSSL